MPEPPLLFDQVRLEPSEARVWLRGEPIHLPPRVFDLLCYFASHPHRLLSKRQLLDAVWPGPHVTEGVLKVAVQQLRQALGDDARAPRLIATVPRKGYRFLPTVRTENLPSSLSRFIGRERELRELAPRLCGGGVVTLCGAGGSGKTRLALEAVRAAAGTVDRVVWVELAGVREPELVPQRIAVELGVREHAGTELVAAMATVCRGSTVLLALDNCEHLADAVAAALADLLAAIGPDTRPAGGTAVLATSREPLGLPGEQVVLLAPLELPPPDAGDEEIRASEAVRLLVDRAASANAGFALPAGDELRRAAEICRRLDGMPLAIELAAARVRLFSLGQILERLDEALDFLATGDRFAPERHQTLRASVEWSVGLLEGAERDLLGILAVFAGSFTVAAVEAVAGEDVGPRGRLVEILGRLVAKSVVEASSERSAEPRFRLLESIRQAMSERESSPASGPAVRERHARFHAGLAAEAEPHLAGTGRATWLRRLGAAADDLRAALAWTRGGDADRLAIGLEAAGSLLWFWFFSGAWGEGRRELRLVSEGWGAGATRAQAKALFARGFLAFCGGDYQPAGERLAAAEAAAVQAGDPLIEGLARSFRSQALMALGTDSVALLELAESGSRATAALPRPWYRAMVANNLGNVRRQRGELELAESAYEHALTLLEDSWDDWVGAMSLRNLAMVEAARGRYEEARALLLRSLGCLRREPEPWFLSRDFDELAAVEVRRGRAETAARLFGASEALRTSIGAPVVPYYQRGYETAIAAAQAALPERRFRRAWESGRSLSPGVVLAELLDT